MRFRLAKKREGGREGGREMFYLLLERFLVAPPRGLDKSDGTLVFWRMAKYAVDGEARRSG